MNEAPKPTIKYTAASCLAAGLNFQKWEDAEAMMVRLKGVFQPVQYNDRWYLRKDRGLVASPLYLVSVE